jgi:hypothetical protein
LGAACFGASVLRFEEGIKAFFRLEFPQENIPSKNKTPTTGGKQDFIANQVLEFGSTKLHKSKSRGKVKQGSMGHFLKGAFSSATLQGIYQPSFPQ